MADVLYMVSALEKATDYNIIAKVLLLVHYRKKPYRPWREKRLYGGEGKRLDLTIWKYWYQPWGKKHGYDRGYDLSLYKKNENGELVFKSEEMAEVGAKILTFPRGKNFWNQTQEISAEDHKKLRQYRGIFLSKLKTSQISEVLSTESKHVFSEHMVKQMISDLRLSPSGNALPKADS